MPATPLYIICSPRPQVGKTLLARLLSEFLLLKNGNVAAFDVSQLRHSLLEAVHRRDKLIVGHQGADAINSLCLRAGRRHHER